MTDLTAVQLRWLADEIGNGPFDPSLQARYDDLASVRDVAISVVRDKRNALLDSPLKVGVAGVANIDNAENVKALERQIASLAKLADDPTLPPSEATGATLDTTEHYALSRSRGR